MNKVAVTTVSNDERYTKHLKLVAEAWDRIGYQLFVVKVGKEPFDINYTCSEYVQLPSEMYDSPSKATYCQSLRFWAASNLLKGHDCILITDADILPIDKKHFTFELKEGEIMHLNATPYPRFNATPQLPACYYAASYKTFHKYFPRDPDPISWLKTYLGNHTEVGRDEFFASKCIQKCNEIRARVIDARIGCERYRAQDEGKITPNRKVVDFHFPYIDNPEEIYNKLIENSDG